MRWVGIGTPSALFAFIAECHLRGEPFSRRKGSLIADNTTVCKAARLVGGVDSPLLGGWSMAWGESKSFSLLLFFVFVKSFG